MRKRAQRGGDLVRLAAELVAQEVVQLRGKRSEQDVGQQGGVARDRFANQLFSAVIDRRGLFRMSRRPLTGTRLSQTY